MKTSYDQCVAELERAGLGPLARPPAVRARRSAALDIFAKSEPRPASHRPTNEFDRLVDELAPHRDRRDQLRATATHQKEFTKACRALDTVYKSYLRPIVIRKDALTKRPAPAETIAKAFAMLQGGDLTAEQRGRLMLGLSTVADQFVKAHPLIADIDDIREKLDRALASGHAGDAAPVIREALTLIGRGRITAADHMRLSLLLNEISHKLETGNAQKD